jgi:hypothetical protein
MKKETKTKVAAVLKSQWLALAPQENYPHTPKITSALDDMEAVIKELEK